MGNNLSFNEYQQYQKQFKRFKEYLDIKRRGPDLGEYEVTYTAVDAHVAAV